MLAYLVETIGPSGLFLYFVVFNQLGQVWNTTLNAGAGGWETYNSGHWAAYAIPLTEKTGSGYYSGSLPAGTAGFLTTEVLYNNQVPTLGDAPYGLGQSQGVNVAAVAGDAAVAANFWGSLKSMETGAVIAGTLGTKAFSTDVVNAKVNAFRGRSLLFDSGALKGQGATISEYDPATGIITVLAGFSDAPVAGDALVIL